MRQTRQSKFHVDLMKRVDELINATIEYRKFLEKHNGFEKAQYVDGFEPLLNKVMSINNKVDEAIKKYNVKKLKFTVLNKEGKLVDARIIKRKRDDWYL